MVPTERIRIARPAPERNDGTFVLYWMLADRRPFWNPALERAASEAHRLGKPLLIVESIACGQRWATARFHRFALQGMAANTAAFASRAVTYVPLVETSPGAVEPLIQDLARAAALVVCDTLPSVLLPALVVDLIRVQDQAGSPPVRIEIVDGCGLLPLQAGRVFERAMDFRRHLQRELPVHLGRFPQEDPLRRLDLPRLSSPWSTRLRALASDLPGLLSGGLARLPVDQAVGPAPQTGGYPAAEAALDRFLDRGLARYAEDRASVDDDAPSGLSPWLHAGHLSPHQVVAAIWAKEGWSPDRLAAKPTGRRDGWWGLSPGAEGFLDQVITWRELGYQVCHHQAAAGSDAASYDAIPPWARQTLDDHRSDRREWSYDLDRFRRAETHDPLWNAAQRQLVAEGRMPNYLRMLWGKKVIEWSPSPEAAFAVLMELNNRYALDGCNPNSVTGITWCFGRFDRPWGPARPIFGSVRWMSSACSARKMEVGGYLRRWG